MSEQEKQDAVEQCEITCSKCGNEYTVGGYMTSSYCPRCHTSNPNPGPDNETTSSEVN